MKVWFALILVLILAVPSWAAELNGKGWPVPKPQELKKYYKVVWKGYVDRSDKVEGDETFAVKFQSKAGDVIFKEYYKTHPFAYVIQKKGEEPYALLDSRCRKVYGWKYAGTEKYEIPDCVLEMHTKPKLGGYCPGQFGGKQEGFIKLRTPEPDDFNPLTDDPDPASDPNHFKACEWHSITEKGY